MHECVLYEKPKSVHSRLISSAKKVLWILFRSSGMCLFCYMLILLLLHVFPLYFILTLLKTYILEDVT